MQIENQKHGGEDGLVAEKGLELQAVGIDTQRQHGDVAEARFVAKAASLGFGVAKPWGNERYDFILDSGYCYWGVQVKSTRVRGSRGYRITIASSSLAAYKATEIDYLVAYVALEDAWYVIPVKLLKGRSSLSFYPRGRGTGRWEKFREGWCQMACPYDEFGASKIITPRCRDKGGVQMAICPLRVLR
jgi:hypothetical protein